MQQNALPPHHYTGIHLMLLTHPNNVQVYVALGVTDMRKSINGLSVMAEEEYALI